MLAEFGRCEKLKGFGIIEILPISYSADHFGPIGVDLDGLFTSKENAHLEVTI